jgi:hypothetical protein
MKLHHPEGRKFVSIIQPEATKTPGQVAWRLDKVKAKRTSRYTEYFRRRGALEDGRMSAVDASPMIGTNRMFKTEKGYFSSGTKAIKGGIGFGWCKGVSLWFC